MPLISNNTSVGINKNKNKHKNKRSHHDTLNAHHARNSCSTNSADELTGSVRDRDTIPNKIKQVWGTTTANTILVDSTQKTNVG
jgi:hypothetical protein